MVVYDSVYGCSVRYTTFLVGELPHILQNDLIISLGSHINVKKKKKENQSTGDILTKIFSEVII